MPNAQYWMLLTYYSPVWSLPIVYTTGAGGAAYMFHISTSTPWTDFEHIASMYLQLRRSGGRLGYRMYRNGGLGELRALQHSIDWERAMGRVGRAAQENVGGELVVFNVSSMFASVCIIKRRS